MAGAVKDACIIRFSIQQDSLFVRKFICKTADSFGDDRKRISMFSHKRKSFPRPGYGIVFTFFQSAGKMHSGCRRAIQKDLSDGIGSRHIDIDQIVFIPEIGCNDSDRVGICIVGRMGVGQLIDAGNVRDHADQVRCLIVFLNRDGVASAARIQIQTARAITGVDGDIVGVLSGIQAGYGRAGEGGFHRVLSFSGVNGDLRGFFVIFRLRAVGIDLYLVVSAAGVHISCSAIDKPIDKVIVVSGVHVDIHVFGAGREGYPVAVFTGVYIHRAVVHGVDRHNIRCGGTIKIQTAVQSLVSKDLIGAGFDRDDFLKSHADALHHDLDAFDIEITVQSRASVSREAVFPCIFRRKLQFKTIFDLTELGALDGDIAAVGGVSRKCQRDLTGKGGLAGKLFHHKTLQCRECSDIVGRIDRIVVEYGISHCLRDV